MLQGFYETQLAVLTGYAFFAILLENFISKRHTRRAEDGSNDLLLGRKTAPGGDPAARSLSYKYLVIYATVMGTLIQGCSSLGSYSLLAVYSCGLVARPVCLFVI
jgi:hypothetical protein